MKYLSKNDSIVDVNVQVNIRGSLNFDKSILNIRPKQKDFYIGYLSEELSRDGWIWVDSIFIEPDSVVLNTYEKDNIVYAQGWSNDTLSFPNSNKYLKCQIKSIEELHIAVENFKTSNIGITS